MASNGTMRVEQCDRDEAADAERFNAGIETEYCRWIRDGQMDDHHLVQAFAGHRILSQADGQREVVMQLAEAAAALNVATDGMQTLRPQRKDVLDALNALGEFYKEQNNG